MATRRMAANRLWPEALVRLRGEINPWLGQLFDVNREASTDVWQAPLSVWEDEQHLHVEVELPGVNKEDLDVTLDEGQLRIVAQRKAPEPQPNYLHNERVFNRIQRVITLPDSVQVDDVDAQLEQGVLRLSMKKKPEVLPKRIEVKTG